MLKKIIKQNSSLHSTFIKSREVLRIIYNTKTRSRFLWNLKKGDTNLTLNYPLSQNSIVIDVGAYKGEFIEKLNKKHKPIIHALEPIEEYSNYLKKKFLKQTNIKVHNFGLLDKTIELKISNLGAGSSIYNRKEGSTEQTISLKSMIQFVEEEQIKEIQLLYLNIEGSEYQLLSHIIETGLIVNIKHLQVQFHNYIDNAKHERKRIRKELKKTHYCVFNFPFIWERWDRL